MKKIWNIEAIPSLLAMAMLGSFATAYFYANFDSKILYLLPTPLTAIVIDRFASNIEYQTGQSREAFNFFSYIPRIGLSVSISIFYALNLWAMHSASYLFPGALYLKLMVSSAAVLFIAIGSTLGRAKPEIVWFNPNPIWINKSTLAFKKTNRVMGWFFVLVGFSTIAIDLVNPLAGLLFGIGIGIPGFLAIFLGYSYFVWKQDPEKIPVPRRS